MQHKDYRNKKGKMPKGERFIMIEHYVTRSEAWADLRPPEFRILLILLERYYGKNNGGISLSVREAAEIGRMAKGTAQKALARLRELGFIKVTFKGSFSQKIKGKGGGWYASEFALTFKSIGDEAPTKEFMSWRSEKRRGQNIAT